jgi:alkaline phosphatase
MEQEGIVKRSAFHSRSSCAAGLVALALAAVPAQAAPRVVRLTPPSHLFSVGEPQPVVSRFLPGQRFDLQATVVPDEGFVISQVRFYVDGVPVSGPVAITPATAPSAPAGAQVATRRAFSRLVPGLHQLKVVATQTPAPASALGRAPEGDVGEGRGNFEIVRLEHGGRPVKNLIILIGDGLGIAHRTAARLMLKGASLGKARGLLAMDSFPYTGLVMTHSLNSIVTDSSPGAACYSTGNKSNNNQHGVFPDDTTDNFDNPRVELLPEYLRRTRGSSLGIVTTSDVFDATPGAWGSHTQSRGAGTGIVDQFFDDRGLTGLAVLMGGGRKWFLPQSVAGSARTAATDYVLPADAAGAWGAAPGAIDPERDLVSEFEAAGFHYAPDKTALGAVPDSARRILGLFALSNMNVALDKVDGRRGNPAVVNDYGFPDQPMLEEMTARAIAALRQSPNGFVLMVEAASIDKQAHNMDSERWILDTIELDRAIAVARRFAEQQRDTLVLVTADHECAGVNIIGASRVSQAELEARAGSGGGAGQLRSGVVGTYEAAGFPRYAIAADGYPETTDVDRRMLIGYAANADRYEDWLTNPQPLRDPQQPYNNVPPLNTYPAGPLNRDNAGNFLVSGQVADGTAVHTASDVPVSAFGRGASAFTGVMDNTDIFFKAAQALVAGPPVYGGGHWSELEAEGR